MKSRRSFLKAIGSGVALSATPGGLAASAPLLNGNRPSNHIRIGIIGAENSHTVGFGKIFNINKQFPGVEVKYVWGETDAFAKKAMENGAIPYQVKTPIDMLGKIDALIVDHRHPKYHLEAAMPFVKAGVPAFIDKPFCYRSDKGRAFLQMARKVDTPVTSYSSVAHSDTTQDLIRQVKNMGNISQVIRTGPVDLDSKYGGVFFYGVHILQPLMCIFGEDIKRVKVSRNGQYGNASLEFSSGLFATLIFKSVSRGWETFVETKVGLIKLQSTVEETDPAKNYVDMVEMFRTGKEPRSHQSILNCVSVLEALEISAESEKWVPVAYQELGY